ncbi:hypothetical protein V2J09_008130, partial [Rumex salicifolius]
SNTPLSPPPSLNLRFGPIPPPYSLKVKCAANPPLTPKHKSDIRQKDPNPIRVMADSFLNALKTPTLSLIVAFTAVFLMTHPPSSWAAPGGRMGGRSSSRSSYSIPSSYSYSSSYSSSSTSPSSPTKEITKEEKEAAEAFARNLLRLYFNESKAIMILSRRSAVFKLQVGLLGSAKSLQSELNRIAETADTSTSKGLSYILTETTVALLRHPDHFIPAYASWLKQSSIEQRRKFDEETLVNVDNQRIKRPTTRTNDGFNNEYIVLPAIKESKDLEEALKSLGSIPSSDVTAVEVLWTPQAENDTLSEKEYREDYPSLKPL